MTVAKPRTCEHGVIDAVCWECSGPEPLTPEEVDALTEHMSANSSGQLARALATIRRDEVIIAGNICTIEQLGERLEEVTAERDEVMEEVNWAAMTDSLSTEHGLRVEAEEQLEVAIEMLVEAHEALGWLEPPGNPVHRFKPASYEAPRQHQFTAAFRVADEAFQRNIRKASQALRGLSVARPVRVELAPARWYERLPVVRRYSGAWRRARHLRSLLTLPEEDDR